MTARFPCLLSDICLTAREFLNSQQIKLKKIGNSFSSFWLYQRTDYPCPRVAKCCANHVSFAVAPNLQPHVLLGNPVQEVKCCHTPGPQCACVPAHGALEKLHLYHVFNAAYHSAVCRVGAMFFLTTNQCFSSISAIELFVVEKKIFM